MNITISNLSFTGKEYIVTSDKSALRAAFLEKLLIVSGFQDLEDVQFMQTSKNELTISIMDDDYLKRNDLMQFLKSLFQEMEIIIL